MYRTFFISLLIFMVLSGFDLNAQINYKGDSLKSRDYSERFCKKYKLSDSTYLKLEEILNYHVASTKIISEKYKNSNLVTGGRVVIKLNSPYMIAINQAQADFESRLEKLLGRKMLSRFEKFLYDERMLRVKSVREKYRR
mgnify:CR=1 FL=1